jgi:mannose/cellobiose epimerase-like protein (N-acyl-D-glucosamine 2-epimerase family)
MNALVQPLPLAGSPLAAHGFSRGDAARQLTHQLTGEILPFWLAKGWDNRRGGFHERFFFDQTPDSLMVRSLRTQFRQINALALAADLGWREGLRLAFRGLEYMIERAWAPDGKPGFVHILAPDGSPMDTRRDASDHASAIMALSTLARATGDAQVTGLLRLLMSYAETALHDDKGMIKPDESGAMPLRRTSAYLHLFEALLAAHAEMEAPHALERAGRYRRLAETVLRDAETGLLPEFLTPLHTPAMEAEAFVLSPGHHAHWAALCRRFERLSGLKPAPFATHLVGAALRACAPATGFLIESIDSAGTVLDSHSGLWAQCALVEAWIAQAQSGAEGAQDAAEALSATMLEGFLKGPFKGGWIDRLDAQGQPAIDTVPASSLNALVSMAVALNADP